jgi:hypothetical protein
MMDLMAREWLPVACSISFLLLAPPVGAAPALALLELAQLAVLAPRSGR